MNHIFKLNRTGNLYPKTYWELLPKEILGAITQRDTGSYYPKRYWELLPKEILGTTTQRDTGSYYPKRYWELLPKEILGAISLFVVAGGGGVVNDCGGYGYKMNQKVEGGYSLKMKVRKEMKLRKKM
ncbi:hypothetical protein Tco_0936955 [Tanacetum coccineum]|uniref:Uncharacterized protein n=1 Tax=Tanacetum coccineum TaxID=301880 RepID=A0ABQ5DDR1_9ASTR